MSLCVSICHPVRLSFCLLSVCLSVSLSVFFLSVSLSFSLSVCLSVCLSVSLTLSLHVSLLHCVSKSRGKGGGESQYVVVPILICIILPFLVDCSTGDVFFLFLAMFDIVIVSVSSILFIRYLSLK